MRLKNISGEHSYLFAYVCFYAFYVHKKDSIFMRIKTSKKKKSFCNFCAFCTFCVFKKHLSENRLSTFCAFCAFYAYKKHLSDSCLFWLFVLFVFFVHIKNIWVKVAYLCFSAFCAFYAFCACEIFSWKKIKLPWWLVNKTS